MTHMTMTPYYTILEGSAASQSLLQPQLCVLGSEIPGEKVQVLLQMIEIG